jgi:uncharacterized membrane protein YhfC
MLYITYALNGLLMVGLPLALGWFLSRKFGVRWGLFFLGAASFAASQLVHLPLLLGLNGLAQLGFFSGIPQTSKVLFNAVILGLAAGLCEGLARYIVLRFYAKSARTWRQGLMFGAGHGGLEAIIFGVLVLRSYVYMVGYRTVDLSTLGYSAADQAVLAQQLTAYWSTPVYITVMGAVERVFALCLHLAATVMVMRAITRNNLLWLLAAIGWHALVDGSVVMMSGSGLGVLAVEGLVGVFALASVGIIWALRPREPEAVPEAEPVTVVRGAPSGLRWGPPERPADGRDAVDDSKYTG